MSKAGRPKGTKKNPFLDQLNIAVNEPINPKDPKSIRKLRAIADKLVTKAVEGDAWAVKEVADRLDGKPAQTADININDTRDLGELSLTELKQGITEQLASGIGEEGASAKPSDSVH